MDPTFIDFSNSIGVGFSLSDDEDNGEVGRKIKRIREKSRRYRERKKSQEAKMRQEIAFYTEANQELREYNQALQDLLNAVRTQVPTPLDSVANEVATPLSALDDVNADNEPEASTDNEASAMIDAHLENEDSVEHNDHCANANKLYGWENFASDAIIPTLDRTNDLSVGKGSNENTASDKDGYVLDWLDWLLENHQYWMDDVNEAIVNGMGSGSNKESTLMIEPDSVPPVHDLSESPKYQSTGRMSREKTNADFKRMKRKKKMSENYCNYVQREKKKHAGLKQSEVFYTQSNARLRQENRELEKMLERAQRYIAGATSGEKHQSMLFEAGLDESAGFLENHQVATSSSIKANDGVYLFQDGSFNNPNNRHSGDDNHPASYFWK